MEDSGQQRSGKSFLRSEPVIGTLLQYKRTMMDLEEELLVQSLHRAKSSHIPTQPSLASSLALRDRALRTLTDAGVLAKLSSFGSLKSPEAGVLFGSGPMVEKNPWTLPKGSIENDQSASDKSAVDNRENGSCSLLQRGPSAMSKCEPVLSTLRSCACELGSCTLQVTALANNNYTKDNEAEEVALKEVKKQSMDDVEEEVGKHRVLSAPNITEDDTECPLCGQTLKWHSEGQQTSSNDTHEDGSRQSGTSQETSDLDNSTSPGNIQPDHHKSSDSVQTPGVWDEYSDYLTGSAAGIREPGSDAHVCNIEKERMMENTCELLCALRDRLQSMQDVLATFVSKTPH